MELADGVEREGGEVDGCEGEEFAGVVGPDLSAVPLRDGEDVVVLVAGVRQARVQWAGGAWTSQAKPSHV